VRRERGGLVLGSLHFPAIYQYSLSRLPFASSLRRHWRYSSHRRSQAPRWSS